MSKSGFSDLQGNQLIRDAIRKIALRGVVSSSTGAVKGTGKTTGYVAKIHTDGDLAGTIDVQEYIQQTVDKTGEMGIGYHEGVLLSAIQDNSTGLVIIPKMYSEVVVTQDADTGVEYVSMFSHVDVIQLESHESVFIGVKEREEFDETNEEGPDVDELEETGVHAYTQYTKDKIVTEVSGGEDGGTTQTIAADSISQDVDGETQVVTDTEGHHVTHGDTKLEIADSEATLTKGSSKVKVTDGVVYVGSDSSTDYAVLGTVLCDVLADLCSYLAQAKTTTQLGPQPLLNMAQYISLKTRIQAAKSGTDILTSKVLIQK